MPPLGLFSGFDTQPRGRKSNSLSRTMFQHRLFLEAKPFPESVVWILDDNLVLEGLSHGTGGTVESQGVDYVSAIKRSKTSGAGVVLCPVTGDSPAPLPSCIRTQIWYRNAGRGQLQRPTLFPSFEGVSPKASATRSRSFCVCALTTSASYAVNGSTRMIRISRSWMHLRSRIPRRTVLHASNWFFQERTVLYARLSRA